MLSLLSLTAQLTPQSYFQHLNGPVGQVFAAVALAALGFAIAFTWLFQWAKRMRAEIETSLRREIANLTKRLDHLESRRSDALAHVVASVAIAGSLGEEGVPLLVHLSKATEALR